MKIILKRSIFFLVLGCFIVGSLPARSEDSVAGAVNEAAKNTKRAIRNGSRKVKDKTCELVDGKLNCAGKKLKHQVQNAGDELSDKVDDLKK